MFNLRSILVVFFFLSLLTVQAETGADIVKTSGVQGGFIVHLGCGDGDLLAHLQDDRQVNGYGLEIDQDNIAACFAKGVNVIEQDLDKGLGNFQSDRVEFIKCLGRGALFVGAEGLPLFHPTCALRFLRGLHTWARWCALPHNGSCHTAPITWQF